MFATFRQSMAWLHTWFGLVLGFVLIVVFFFGALSVFDREIDRWSIPASRFEPRPLPSFDAMLRPVFERIVPDADDVEAARSRVEGPLSTDLPVMDYSVYTTHRDPVITLYKSFGLPNAHDPEDHIHGHVTLDPRSGAEISEQARPLGSDFFYPLHYSLHLEWQNLGYWIVGLASLTMLAALVSGVVIHRRLFRELFTFRPQKQTQRSVLDLHNLTGVVALPFHFLFALTGLVIFAGIYFPAGSTLLKPMHDAHEREESLHTGLPLKPAGVAAPLGSVDAMVTEAQRRWAARDMAGEVGYLFVNHIGDSSATVSLYRAGTDRVTLTGEGIHFDGVSGAVIREDPPFNAVGGINNFLTGLHLQHFRHWTLRWLYFVGGLAGCACIATGFLFFARKRREQHLARGIGGARWVDALSIATVTGTLIATASLLSGNRLLPEELADRAFWEEATFWCAWLAALAHATLRVFTTARGAARAWREQCWAVAVLAVTAVVANAATTGDHLVATISRGYWPVAGVDLVLLVAALIAARTALKLRRRATTSQEVPARGLRPSGAARA
ncbi:MAG: PepSY-associated TM helix domain-containing protein [Steroidobacteraceae bacterium]